MCIHQFPSSGHESRLRLKTQEMLESTGEMVTTNFMAWSVNEKGGLLGYIGDATTSNDFVSVREYNDMMYSLLRLQLFLSIPLLWPRS